LPAALREKYFTPEGGLWRVSPELHSRVRWETVNLLSEAEASRFATSPVIFCRNVFIYFSESAIRKVVGLFAKQMPVPGYLFVAASESLLRLTTGFELQEIKDAFVYVKRG
jgi:chemotaxis protein methyltransferase CheR